jgi:cytochrome c biogenesis protein CcdA
MNQLFEAFALGTTAILTNACLLPLYPGLLAFLAGNADDARARRAAPLLGVIVLLGILAMMLLIGFILYLIGATFGDVLMIILPVVYAAVIVMGVLLLLDRNPFARLATGRAPLLSNPYGSAFAYGLLLAPMTLPCTGPIITSAFVLGARDAGALVDGLLYFLAFGLGFGWIMALLPLAALPLQRRIVGWLARQHTTLNRTSGVLLIAIGMFGVLTEILPQISPMFEIAPIGWLIYWLAVAGVIAGMWALRPRVEG